MSSNEAIFVLADSLRLDDVDTRGLAARIAAIGWERLLEAADNHRLSNVLSLHLRQHNLVPPIPAMRLADGRLTVPAALELRLNVHLGIRAAQRARLFELVAALNKVGIEPLLLKGARSLWIDAPDWRAMHDLDLLIPRNAVARAQKVAKRLGYIERDGVPPGYHHGPNLYRDDLPGWIEFHHRAGVPQLEALMPTGELWGAACRSVGEGGQAYMAPQILHVLHSMLHHHIGHWRISMKGLYEFAAETARLDEDEQHRMMQRAARHPRFLAILDLWVAAAADLFGMPVVSALSLVPDAARRWSKRRAHLDDRTWTPTFGRAEELAAATRAERLARVDHWLLRHRLPARLATRWSFMQRPRFLRIRVRRGLVP